MYININGYWRKTNGVFVNISGYWRKVNSAFINISGTWRKFFTTEVLAPQYPVIISQATNGTTYLTTLTGTNYYWSPGPPVLTYRFQWWNGVSWSDIFTGNAINPSYGSSTSYTQLLQSTGPSVYVQPNQVNRFRFKVDATYGVESASSISSETTIQGPTSVTLTAGTAATTSIDLSWTASTGANRYMVYYSTNNSVFTLFGGAPSTSVTVTGLSSSTLYYFKVIPITGSTNDTGYYGSYSNTVSQTTLTPQYTVTYSMTNGGTVSPTSATVNAGSAVILPTPTFAGYTFSGWYDTPSGNYTYGGPTNGAAGASFTPPSSITMYARWTLTPIIPTITMQANSGVTQTSGTINWTSTNQASFSSSGTISGSGTTATSVTNNSLSAGTTYTGTATVTSSTGDTASANYSLTTSLPQYTVTWNANGGTGGGSTGPFNSNVAHVAPSVTRSGYSFNGYFDTQAGNSNYGPVAVGTAFYPPSNITMYARWTLTFVTPSSGPPQISNNQLGFVRSGTSVTWYSDYPSVSGYVSYIIGMEWQIRTTNSTTTTPLNTGTYAGGGSGDGLQGNTTKYITYPVNTPYPYSAAGTIWAFRIKSTENTAATSSARYARARVIMMGTDNNVYFGTWSTNI